MMKKSARSVLAAPYREIHKAGDAIEPRAARAFMLALARLRARVPVGEIADRIKAGDMRAVDEIITRLDIEDAFQPAAEIVRDAVLRGGKIAAEEM
jgi:hypothetical protein